MTATVFQEMPLKPSIIHPCASTIIYYFDEMQRAGIFLNPEDYPDPTCDQSESKLSELFDKAKKETADYVIDTYLQKEKFYL